MTRKLSDTEISILTVISEKVRGLKSLEIAKLTDTWLVSLYPALHELEKDGLIESCYDNYVDPDRNGLRSKLYKITKNGLKESIARTNNLSNKEVDFSWQE